MKSAKQVSEDEFLMWRSVFAFALIDGVLSVEEQNILSNHLKEVPFTLVQLRILKNDMNYPQDIEGLFEGIQNEDNQKRFCELARTLVWCDGDMARQEKIILERVSCIENSTRMRAHLKDSAESPWMKSYIDRYEDMSFASSNQNSHLFEVAV